MLDSGLPGSTFSERNANRFSLLHDHVEGMPVQELLSVKFFFSGSAYLEDLGAKTRVPFVTQGTCRDLYGVGL